MSMNRRKEFERQQDAVVAGLFVAVCVGACFLTGANELELPRAGRFGARTLLQQQPDPEPIPARVVGAESHDAHDDDGPGLQTDSWAEWEEEDDHYYHDHMYDHMYGSHGYGEDAEFFDEHHFHTHGSLTLNTPEDLREFLALDHSEPTVVGAFSRLDDDPDWAVFAELAETHSHLLRFAHTTSPGVREALGLGGDNDTAVVVAKAPHFVHSAAEAGRQHRFPAKRLYVDSLTKFVFLESSPLVGLFEWRAAERAAVAEVPLLVLFAKVDEPAPHHDPHHGDPHHEPPPDDTAWSFDELVVALSPLAEDLQHQVHLLVGDKRWHMHELFAYQLHLDEDDSTMALTLREGHHHYSVALPALRPSASGANDEARTELGRRVHGLLNDVREGTLKPLPDDDGLHFLPHHYADD